MHSIMETAVYLLVFAILGSVHLSLSTFTVHPDNVTVLLGENATFHCETDSSPLAWIITVDGGKTLDSTNTIDDDDFDARGIIEVGTTLTIPAIMENNNTNVACRVLTFFPVHGTKFSNNGSLKILGPPSSPEPVMTFINNTLLVVDWTPPFTWENHSITHYDIVVTNMTDSTTDSFSGNSTEHHILGVGEENGCDILVVNVSASSDIGKGQVASVTGGFPIAPSPFNFSECSDCKVTFLKDGTPLFKTKFELPPICPYQTGQYRVWLVSEDVPGVKELIKSANYSSDIVNLVPVLVETGLKINGTYSLVVMVSTCQGTAVNNITFSTEFIPLNTKDSGLMSGMSGENQAGIIAGAVMGALFVSLAVIGIVGVVYKRRKQSGVAEVSLDKMFRSHHGGEHYHQPDTNNCTYETIDGYQGGNLKRFVHVISPDTSPNLPPRKVPSLPPRNDQNVISEQVDEMVEPDKNREAESGTYLQLVSRENSSENCNKNGIDPEVRSSGSGLDNEMYTAMQSVSLRTPVNSNNTCAVNRLAIQSQGFNEDNYMVFIEP